MPQNSLVNYESDKEENVPAKRPKLSTKNIRSLNQLTQTYGPEKICQNCGTVAGKAEEDAKKLEEIKALLAVAEKTIKSLQEELFNKNKIIAAVNNEEYKMQKEIELLKKTNGNLVKQLEVARNNNASLNELYNKLEKEYAQLMEKYSEAEKNILDQKLTEDKLMLAEKFISKADAEKEEESARANEADAKYAKLIEEYLPLKAEMESLRTQLTLLQNENNVLKRHDHLGGDAMKRKFQEKLENIQHSEANNFLENGN